MRALEAEAEATLIELTEVSAPPFGESARAALFATLLRDAGLDEVEIDGVEPVLGEGSSKRAAERAAATALLGVLSKSK